MAAHAPPPNPARRPSPPAEAEREPVGAGVVATAAAAAAIGVQRRVPSGELFGGALEIEIVHREQVYRLRQTALGKLILTK